MRLARLREWRESRGLTQKDLAAAAHTSEYTVARAESGLPVRPNTARRLAEVMDVTVADLLERPPVPLAEAPQGGDIPNSLAELLERRGARTRHLADRELSRAIRRLPTEDVIRIVREVREEVDLVGEDLARLYTSESDPRAMGVVDQFSGQIWRAQIALGIRREQEEELEQEALDIRREQEKELEQEGRALFEEARPLAGVR